MERSTVALSVLAVVLLFGVIGFSTNYLNNSYLAGMQSTTTTPSQAIIGKYVAISLSSNLTAGIHFGNITVLPSPDVNATYNYNSTIDPFVGANETLYYVSLSAQSNVNADFCVRSTLFNTSGGAEIELGNYTWNDSITNVYDYPNFTGKTAITTSYVKGVSGVAPGNDVYYRFWLNVTDYIQPGIYNSTVWFEGVPTGESC